MKSRVKGIWGVKEMKRLFCMAIRKGMKLDAANCWEEAQICESEEFEIKTRVSVSFYIVQILSAVAKRQIVTLLLNKPELVVAVWFPSRQPKGMVPPKAGKEMLVFPPTLQSCFPSLPFLSIKVLDVAVQWLNANFVHKKKKDLCSVRSMNWLSSGDCAIIWNIVMTRGSVRSFGNSMVLDLLKLPEKHVSCSYPECDT